MGQEGAYTLCNRRYSTVPHGPYGYCWRIFLAKKLWIEPTRPKPRRPFARDYPFGYFYQLLLDGIVSCLRYTYLRQHWKRERDLGLQPITQFLYQPLSGRRYPPLGG